MSGRVDGARVAIGNGVFLRELGVDVEQAEAALSALADDGKTPVLVAVDGQIACVLAIADAVRATSRLAVLALRDLGIDVVMLTGDGRRTATAVARDLGIRRVVADVLPEGKLREIERLMGDGLVVAMVGDGINDAPALAAADVGIAMGSGTDVAIEASDVALLRGDARGAVTATELSRRTMRTMKQNLFWAFVYNVVGIPVAAGALYEQPAAARLPLVLVRAARAMKPTPPLCNPSGDIRGGGPRGITPRGAGTIFDTSNEGGRS